jgi:hypothetical protein
LQVGCLFRPLVAADMGAGFGAKKERHFLLGQMCAFPMCTDVIG